MSRITNPWKDLEALESRLLLSGQAPVLNPIASMAGTVGQPVAFTLSASDPEGDPLTYSALGLPGGATFDTTAGKFSWTPGTTQTGINGMKFTVSDGTSTASQTTCITVKFHPGDANGDGQVNDADYTIWADNCSLTATGKAPTQGDFNGDGMVNDADYTLWADNYSFGMTPPSTNHAPVMAPLNSMSGTVGQPVSFTVSATDPDGDLLTYSALGLPSGATFNTQTGQFNWTPTSSQVDLWGMKFTASDGTLTASQTMCITVSAASGTTNHAPVMAPLSNVNATVGQPVNFIVTATDPDGDPLTYSAAGLPSGATFNTQSGAFSWTPTSNQVNTWTLQFTASDGSLTASQSMGITVAAAGGGSGSGMGASAAVLNTNRTRIDTDGDGYGVNSPLGPDADPNDPAVQTWTQAMAKWGSTQAFVNHLGYYPKHIYMGVPSSSTTLQPGDMVIVTSSMDGNYTYGSSNTHGTATDPIIFLAQPGSNIKITGRNDAIDISNCSYEVWDGFELDGAADSGALGINMSYSQNMTFKNLNIHGWTVGVQAAQNLQNITIQNCVFHDSTGSHGLYLESRDQPDTNLYVHDNLFFNNKNGMQMNGRVTNLDIENNVFYNNWLAGISWLEGVHDSTIKDNLIFNNGTQGIVINDYDDTPSFGIVPYDQTNNLIANNTIWVGQYNGNLTGLGAGYQPANQQAIAFTDATAAQSIMISAIIKNNVIVTDNGSTFRMEPSKFSSASTISNNLIYRYSGSGNIMLTGNTTYGFSALPSFNSANTGNIYDSVSPFVDVALSYYTDPTRFNFNLA